MDVDVATNDNSQCGYTLKNNTLIKILALGGFQIKIAITKSFFLHTFYPFTLTAMAKLSEKNSITFVSFEFSLNIARIVLGLKFVFLKIWL